MESVVASDDNNGPQLPQKSLQYPKSQYSSPYIPIPNFVFKSGCCVTLSLDSVNLYVILFSPGLPDLDAGWAVGRQGQKRDHRAGRHQTGLQNRPGTDAVAWVAPAACSPPVAQLRHLRYNCACRFTGLLARVRKACHDPISPRRLCVDRCRGR